MPSLPEIENFTLKLSTLEFSFDLFPGANKYYISVKQNYGKPLFPEQEVYYNKIINRGFFDATKLSDQQMEITAGEEYACYLKAKDISGNDLADSLIPLQLSPDVADQINARFKGKKTQKPKERFWDPLEPWRKVLIGFITLVVIPITTIVFWPRHYNSSGMTGVPTNGAPIDHLAGTNTASASTNTVPAIPIPMLGMSLGGATTTNQPTATDFAATNDDIKIAESMRETVAAMNAANTLRQEKEGLRRQINQLKLAAEVQRIQILTNLNGPQYSPSIIGSNNVINNHVQIVNIGNSNSNVIVNPMRPEPKAGTGNGTNDNPIIVLPTPRTFSWNREVPTEDVQRQSVQVRLIAVEPVYDTVWDTRGWHWTPGPENGTENLRIAGGQSGWMARDHPLTPKQYHNSLY